METCDSPLILFFKTEYVVIDNTVHPDKKLIAVTSSTPKESSTGLMILMVAGGIAGGICGRAINKKIDEKTVDKLFIALMVLMIVINIYNIFKFM